MSVAPGSLPAAFAELRSLNEGWYLRVESYGEGHRVFFTPEEISPPEWRAVADIAERHELSLGCSFGSDDGGAIELWVKGSAF